MDPNLPDHDQLHFQFGYILYHKNGTSIVSPPLGHRWVLHRSQQKPSDQIYICREIIEPDSIVIDGELEEMWNRAAVENIGSKAQFRLLWSSSTLYFAITVSDSSVTPRDFVELHIDMHKTRSHFAGINHRSIRFGPLSRSYALGVDLKSGAFKPSDSIRYRIREEMKWRYALTENGYLIEAAIPFTVLSDYEFPPERFGLNVSVVNRDEGMEGYDFYSWSGSQYYNRYSPAGWGTIVLRQGMFPLKLVMILFGIISVGIASFIVIYSIHQSSLNRKYESEEQRHPSPTTSLVLSAIETHHSEPHLTLQKVSKLCSLTPEEIKSSLQSDMETTFERLLLFTRISAAKKQMRTPEITLDEVAERCGFSTPEQFSKGFSEIMSVPPERYFKAVLEELEEDEQE
ncbi:hypothetical protein CHISP_1077 [Chitinispirillum alkaliphilum]|nr:hypothetical protein CHISP_1077 [Chitinispirillum alkaliphilum]